MAPVNMEKLESCSVPMPPHCCPNLPSAEVGATNNRVDSKQPGPRQGSFEVCSIPCCDEADTESTSQGSSKNDTKNGITSLGLRSVLPITEIRLFVSRVHEKEHESEHGDLQKACHIKLEESVMLLFLAYGGVANNDRDKSLSTPSGVQSLASSTTAGVNRSWRRSTRTSDA